MAYQAGNVFEKIIQGSIPCDKVGETCYTIAFKDINPKAPAHILVVPKGLYSTYDDFIEQATSEEILDLFHLTKSIIKSNPLLKDGYKLNINSGEKGGQEVPHFHLHLMGGWA